MSLTFYDALPSDKILYIASFCSFDSLKAYSRTNKFTRENCGMLKLMELYTSALQTFKNLQSDFIVRSNLINEPNPKNVYFVNLKNYKPLITENVLLQSDYRFSKKFIQNVGYFFEKNNCFDLEDITDLLSSLKEDQFIAAVRLSDVRSFSNFDSPNTNWITDFVFNLRNQVRTITYTIKEVRCIFSQDTNISPFEIYAINKAATKAFEPPKSFFSSLIQTQM